MAIFQNNAEGGVNGVTPTTSDSGSGDAWANVVKATGAILQYDNSAPLNGLMDYVFGNRGTAGASYLEAQDGDLTTHFNRVYFKFDVADITQSMNILTMRSSAGVVGGIIGLQATEKLRIASADGTTIFTLATTLTQNTRYRLEWKFDANGATCGLQVKLFTGDSTTVLEDSGAQTVTPGSSITTWRTVRMGITNSVANAPSSSGLLHMDDPLFFATDWPGPSLLNQQARPDADIAAAGWTPTPGSPTTLFDKVDDVTTDDADYITSPVAS